MALKDIFRNRQDKEIKKVAAEIFDRHNMMIGHIADFQDGYTQTSDGWRLTELSQSFGEDGLANGLTKTTKYADGVTPTEYEFLIYKGENSEHQIVTQYYKVGATGNFANSNGLATFNLEYNALVNGQYIPCEASVRTNGASAEFLPVNPREVRVKADKVSFEDLRITPETCIPDTNDILHIINEYARVNGIALGQVAANADDLYMGMGQR